MMDKAIFVCQIFASKYDIYKMFFDSTFFTSSDFSKISTYQSTYSGCFECVWGRAVTTDGTGGTVHRGPSTRDLAFLQFTVKYFC